MRYSEGLSSSCQDLSILTGETLMRCSIPSPFGEARLSTGKTPALDKLMRSR